LSGLAGSHCRIECTLGSLWVYDQPAGRHDRNAGLRREANMDALSDVLRVVHLTGGVFLHAEFFAPWCIAARVAPEHCAPLLGPASHLILYHYVVEGDLHRRVNTLCQGEAGLQDRLVLFQVYHNFVLPDASLRQRLALPEPPHGHDSAKLWQPCTPAMAVGWTDHVWLLKEVLLYRVPPWLQARVR
jgi:hypothetical protein